jgi:hypothetical protein
MLDFKVLDPRWLTCGFYPCCYKKVSETAGKYLVSTLDLFTDTRLQGRLDSGRVLGTFLVAYSAGCTDSRQNLFMVMMLDTIGHIIQVCEDMYPYSAGTRLHSLRSMQMVIEEILYKRKRYGEIGLLRETMASNYSKIHRLTEQVE